MKKITISLLFVFVMFLGLSLTIKAETGLSYTKISETNPVSISEGVSYKKIVAKSSTDDGTVGNQSVNVTTFAPNSVHFVSWATLKESTVKTTNILEAIKDYETMYPEMMVVAAINDDYFDINDTGNMINPCVREGIIINDTAEEWFYGMGLKDDGSYKLTKKGGEVISSNDETALLKIYDSSNINVLRTITVSVGSIPTDGQTSIIYGAATISTDAAYFSITPSNNVKIGSVRYYKGGVHSYNATGATIITKDEEVARLLDANPTVEIGVTPTGDWAGFNTIIGVGSQFLKNGEVLNYDEIGDQGEEYIGTWCPRTTRGIKENGTVVFMTIDGRQSTKQMDGVTLRENALALIEEGCVQGFNLDGGGSTTMAVLLDGQMTVVNSPSDGSLRHDADFVLAVVPRVQISLTSTSSVVNDKAMMMGSFDISKLNGFTFDASEVYLNGKATGQTAEGFIFNDLEQGMNYNLAVYLTYKVGAASYTRPFGSVNVVTGGENTITKQAPSNPQMSFEKTSNGF
ncbi:MAG: phosphodiester glycosidase family protein, partial [Bacilli bacterium]|nr:phosphodiester glycosidase family protein [Bacilli bacterium]